MKAPGMSRSSARFLQGVVMLVGLAALAFLLGEPHLEGRNAHATLFEIYFKDPFLAYVYAGSIPFFLALYRAFRLLGDVSRTGHFSSAIVNALRTIQVCALVVIGFIAGAAVIILLTGEGEDRPAGIFMTLLAASGAGAIALAATLLARNLQARLRRAEVC
jgi:small-conductance mechanosensitive channel